jgi:hypothetical protein
MFFFRDPDGNRFPDRRAVLTLAAQFRIQRAIASNGRAMAGIRSAELTFELVGRHQESRQGWRHH